jgi:putative NADH-flavin reductase
MFGRRVAQEALRREHKVADIARDPVRIPFLLTPAEGNTLNRENVTQVVAGHDVVVSTIEPSENQPRSAVPEATQSLLEGVKRVGVKRLFVVDGTGTLKVAPGVR